MHSFLKRVSSLLSLPGPFQRNRQHIFLKKKYLVVCCVMLLLSGCLTGCAGQAFSFFQSSPVPSPGITPAVLSSTPLTILTVSEGTVLVMHAGGSNWVEALVGTSLEPQNFKGKTEPVVVYRVIEYRE